MSLGWVKKPLDRLLVRIMLVALPLAACVPIALTWKAMSSWSAARFWLTTFCAFVVFTAGLLLGLRFWDHRPGFIAGRVGSAIGGLLWFVGAMGMFACFAAATWRGLSALGL